MRITVQFENGGRAEALVLGRIGNLLRVIVAGRSETEEWLMLDDCWRDENGHRIDVETIIAVGSDFALWGPASKSVAAAGALN